MKVIFPLLLCAGLLGCQAQSEESGDARLSSQSFIDRDNLKGKKIIAVADDRWLLSSESYGLMLVDAEGKELARHQGGFEGLDLREALELDGSTALLATTLDKDAGQIAIFSLAGNRLQKLASLDTGEAQAEAQCLFRDPQDGHISLFAIDAQGMVHERIIYDNDRQTLVDIPVRQFIGVPEAEACAVDDLSQSLYLAEEAVGVWRYSANAEADPVREAVLLRAPHGPLQGEVSDVALAADGSVWALVPASKTLHRLAGDRSHSAYQLNETEEPETISLSASHHGLTVAIYDEGRDNYQRAQLDIEMASRSRPTPLPRVPASAQTEAVARFGDAADDPVIWFDREDPSSSLVIATDKREGLKVYDLQGKLLQSLPVGRVNNVDLREGFSLQGRTLPLIAASNRSHNSISLFSLADSEQLTQVGDVATGLSEVYGLCMYQSESGTYVFVNDTDGRYEQYRLDTQGDAVAASRVREFRLPSQPEGCVADDSKQVIYMGEEAAGIWLTDAEPHEAELKKIISVGEQLVADVEGLDIYHAESQSYLVVSSQGNDSYVLFGLQEGYPLLAQFRVGKNLAAGIDGASETDGLAVMAAALPGYPQGLLVVQDGRNNMPQQPQNFKLVSWEHVAALLDKQ